MLKEKSKGYKILFAVFLFFLLLKATALLTTVGCLGFYVGGTYETSAVSEVAVIALLADFVANLAVWWLNRGLKLINKAGAYILLFSPVLLLAVMFLSIVGSTATVSYGADSAEAVMVERIAWVLTVIYLFLPDLFLTLNLIHIKQRLEAADRPKPLTVSERIKNAKR
jgi:hypothetical protein